MAGDMAGSSGGEVAPPSRAQSLPPDSHREPKWSFLRSVYDPLTHECYISPV